MSALPDLPPRARIVELRQYTLVPGRRDELIDLFDREFVSSQEQLGIHVIGQFHDLDDPDRFVWLRGFDSMSSRATALHDFYYGPVWARHRIAANATMVDSDNVLLLQPVNLGPSYPLYGRRDATEARSGLICADVFLTTLPAFLRDGLADEVARTGADVVGIFETAALPNDFPQLPVRTDTVIVVLTRFDNGTELAEFTTRTNGATPVERRRLRPTAMSQLR